MKVTDLKSAVTMRYIGAYGHGDNPVAVADYETSHARTGREVCATYQNIVGGRFAYKFLSGVALIYNPGDYDFCRGWHNDAHTQYDGDALVPTRNKTGNMYDNELDLLMSDIAGNSHCGYPEINIRNGKPCAVWVDDGLTQHQRHKTVTKVMRKVYSTVVSMRLRENRVLQPKYATNNLIEKPDKFFHTANYRYYIQKKVVSYELLEKTEGEYGRWYYRYAVRVERTVTRTAEITCYRSFGEELAEEMGLPLIRGKQGLAKYIKSQTPPETKIDNFGTLGDFLKI